MCSHSQNSTSQSNCELLSKNQCMCLNRPWLNTSGYGVGRHGNMKMLAGSECNSHFFIVLNSKLVKNTTYFLQPKSRAPYSRIPYITTQISEFALNIIFHFLMNIFEPVLEWGGRKRKGWGVGANAITYVPFLLSWTFCFYKFIIFI